MFKVRQFLFLQFSQAVGGTALPPAEHAILAAFMAENPLRNAKRGSINRNFMTREMTSSGGTLCLPTNPVQSNCCRVFICPYVELLNFVIPGQRVATTQPAHGAASIYLNSPWDPIPSALPSPFHSSIQCAGRKVSSSPFPEEEG